MTRNCLHFQHLLGAQALMDKSQPGLQVIVTKAGMQPCNVIFCDKEYHLESPTGVTIMARTVCSQPEALAGHQGGSTSM
jgi:hypothetical protein